MRRGAECSSKQQDGILTAEAGDRAHASVPPKLAIAQTSRLGRCVRNETAGEAATTAIATASHDAAMIDPVIHSTCVNHT